MVFIVGCCFMLFYVVGCCWVLLDFTRCCWVLLDVAGCCCNVSNDIQRHQVHPTCTASECVKCSTKAPSSTGISIHAATHVGTIEVTPGVSSRQTTKSDARLLCGRRYVAWLITMDLTFSCTRHLTPFTPEISSSHVQPHGRPGCPAAPPGSPLVHAAHTPGAAPCYHKCIQSASHTQHTKQHNITDHCTHLTSTVCMQPPLQNLGSPTIPTPQRPPSGCI